MDRTPWIEQMDRAHARKCRLQDKRVSEDQEGLQRTGVPAPARREPLSNGTWRFDRSNPCSSTDRPERLLLSDSRQREMQTGRVCACWSKGRQTQGRWRD